MSNTKYNTDTLTDYQAVRADKINAMLLSNADQTFIKWINGSDFLGAMASLFEGKPQEQIYSFKGYPFDLKAFIGDSNLIIGNTYKVGRLEHAVPAEESNPRYVKGRALDKDMTRLVATIVIGRYYSDYRDFYPYTKIWLYLPFVSCIELDVNRVMGKTLNIYYTLDLVEGKILARVTNNYGTEIYAQAEANAAVDIPLTQTNTSERIMAGAQIAGNVVTAVATGGVTAPLLVSNSLQAIRGMQPSTQLTGISSGFLKFYSSNVVHLIIQRPKDTQTTAQRAEYICENGLPVENYYSYYEIMQGIDTERFTSYNVERKDFTELIGEYTDITDEELAEFVALLNAGVYLPKILEE